MLYLTDTALIPPNPNSFSLTSYLHRVLFRGSPPGGPQPIDFTAFNLNSNGYGNLQSKVLLTVSRSHPSFPPQPHVYPRASSDSTLERLPSRTNLIGPMPKLDPNSRPFNLLQPLCRREKSQPLWNQANPASFPKTPGVGWVPRSRLGTLGGSRRASRPLRCPLRSTSPVRTVGSALRSPLVTCHSPLSSIYLWNQHLQKCIKTNNFNSLYNQHL
jgi:hypothetical protein